MNVKIFSMKSAIFGVALFGVAMSVSAAEKAVPTAAARFGGPIAKAESPSFRRHVVPLASKLGCSGRECHGSFQGRGDFRLSLFGYDFEKDHKAITADKDHRVRVNLEHPEKSLFIQKPTKQVAHKGGRRYDDGSWEHNVFLKWIKEGAKLDVEETGEFDRLEITPKEIVFTKPGETVKLKVLAYWKDGTVEDVTQLTRFRTNDDSVVEASEDGVVKILGKGDSHIVAFYDNGVLPVPVMLPMGPQNGAKYPKVATRTKVDELIVQKLRKAGILPADLCSDVDFLRRASLDITGTLPTPDEIKLFLADPKTDKRTRKIDELLNRSAYAAWWATKLSDYTGNNPAQLRANNLGNAQNSFGRQWYDWLNTRVAKNMPYDKIIEGIVLASTRSKPDQTFEEMCAEMAGYFREKDPVNFADRENMPWFWTRQNLRMAEEKAMAFAYSFLGVRIQCAQCHKHPFDQWTQQDFQQFQAFFEPIRYAQQVRKEDGDFSFTKLTAKIREEAGIDPKATTNQQNLIQTVTTKRLKAGEPVPWQEVYVQVAPQRKLTEREIEQIKKRNPNFGGRVITPKLLGGTEVVANEFPDPRQPLMKWLKDAKNPYFARAFVNRTWASYFGRGMVEPADDQNLANPPSNAELMDYLSDGFVKSGYDMKWLHRQILNSDAYQRSWKTNPTNQHDEKNFSHQLIRRLPAEVVADAISLATASSDKMVEFANNMEARAVGAQGLGYSQPGQRRTGSSYMLNIFGKPQRETNCDCERTSDPTLLQTLYTRNDPEMLTRLESAGRDNGSWIADMRRNINSKTVAAKKPEEIIEEVFLRTVSRFPTAAEMALAKEDLAAAKDVVEGARDLLWAMLNTREFMVNH